jgi:hypothetical protein
MVHTRPRKMSRTQPAEIARSVLLRAIACCVLTVVGAPAAAPQTPAPPAAPQPTRPKPAPQNAATKPAAPRSEGRTDDSRCIGVVSTIGDGITLKTVGITVFGNAATKVPIESWRVDDLVGARAAAVLGKTFNIKRVYYPKGAFAPIEEQHGLFYNSDEEFKGILSRVTATTKCDRYVAIYKISTAIGSSNQSLYGLGIFHDSGIFSSYYLYAMFGIGLYDGRDFSVLTRQQALIGQRSFLAAIRGPNREVDQTWWPTGDAAPKHQAARRHPCSCRAKLGYDIAASAAHAVISPARRQGDSTGSYHFHIRVTWLCRGMRLWI